MRVIGAVVWVALALFVAFVVGLVSGCATVTQTITQTITQPHPAISLGPNVHVHTAHRGLYIEYQRRF
jgi:uncharacterized protein YceK